MSGRSTIRADKADSFRLISLLEYYDNRVVATNKHTWLSTFTHGAEIHPRRDWSVSLPRSHNRVLQSLPVDKRLDVAVLLAVRVAFRDNIPRQVRETFGHPTDSKFVNQRPVVVAK